MRKIAKLTRIAITPSLWRAACHGVAATVEHDAALEDYSFATVIDAGANKGQFAVYALFRWPRARVISFEPLPEPRAKLARVTGGRAEIHDCALGAEAGEACMHIASRADSSSLLALGKRQKTIFKMEEVAELTVPVRRLDGCVGSDLTRPSLLKIDVQGYELEVLKGASGLLHAIDAVYVEVSWTELYQGQAMHDEVDALLAGAGFKSAGTFNEHLHDGEPIQADILYLRQ